MLRRAGSAIIRAYQRHLSPRKGFRCAYGALHGSGTCSSIGLRMMEQDGLWAFLLGMPQQFRACHHAAAILQEGKGPAPRKKPTDGCHGEMLGAVGEGSLDCCGQAIMREAGSVALEAACCLCASADT